jgi:heme-degrading monooxygenase HmoA
VIARVWSARTTSALSAAYLEHLSQRVLPELRSLQGFEGCTVLTRSAQDVVEIIVISRWHSLEAIETFAGKDREAAVVAPEAAALLTDYDRRVRHFETAFTEP